MDVPGQSAMSGVPTPMGLPMGGQRPSISEQSAAVSLSPSPQASMPMVPQGGPTPGQVLAEQLPGTISKAVSVFGAPPRATPVDEATLQPQQPQGLEGIMSKIGGAAKSFFDSPATNLASSSAVAAPAGDMKYQTPFFSTGSSYLSGSTGETNSNKMLSTFDPMTLVANYLTGG